MLGKNGINISFVNQRDISQSQASMSPCLVALF